MNGYGGGGGPATPKLDIKQLYEKRQVRDTAKLRAYNQILAQIHNRIFAASQLPNNTASILYTVPPFILGLPAIDLEDCIVYLVTMLRNGGFAVRYSYPNLLSISWKHYEREYNVEQNPIVKAMMPPETTSKKGKEGKRGLGGSGASGDSARSVSFAPLPGNNTSGRSTTDYRPPDSFLKTMGQSQTRGAPPTTASAAAAPPARDVLADLWKF